ncbi:mitotic checkpoint protein BUB3.1 [Capsicum annuum]
MEVQCWIVASMMLHLDSVLVLIILLGGQVTTGSWDRTLKCWDPRGASGGQEHTLVGTYPQPERVYSLSLVGNRLVVATAWNHVNVYDLRNMSQPEQQRESSLKYRITYVQCYPDGTGLFLILYLLLHSRA